MHKKKFTIILLALCTLLPSCKSSETTPYIEYSGVGTVQNVYGDDSIIVTDNLGNVYEEIRNIREKYPELKDFRSENYPGIYVPVLNAYLPKSDWTLLYETAEGVTVQNKKAPTASYTFGRIADISPVDSSDYAVFSTVYPLIRLCYMDEEGNPARMPNYYSEITNAQQDQINGLSAQGLRFKSVSKYDYVPAYTYMVMSYEGDDVTYELMVTDNVCGEGDTRNQGEPKEDYVLDTRTNMDGKRLIDATIAAPEVEYQVYHGDITMAIPSFSVVELASNGFRIKDRDDESTPFNHAGATVVYLDEPLDTKSQVETLTAELQSISGNDEVLKCETLQYEENVDFLGVSTATHLYGTLFIREGGLDVREEMCGTGKVNFDIYTMSRNEKLVMVMFYRGEDQDEEFKRFIEYNTY